MEVEATTPPANMEVESPRASPPRDDQSDDSSGAESPTESTQLVSSSWCALVFSPCLIQELLLHKLEMMREAGTLPSHLIDAAEPTYPSLLSSFDARGVADFLLRESSSSPPPPPRQERESETRRPTVEDDGGALPSSHGKRSRDDFEERRDVVVLGGAGMSTSAGIPDFRSPGTGLYDNLQKYDLPRPQAIFELEYFKERPAAFYELARELWPGAYEPTPTHLFIRLLHEKGRLLRCFTQNIDSLETAAGLPADRVVAAHGNFDAARCVDTGEEVPISELKDALFGGGCGHGHGEDDDHEEEEDEEDEQQQLTPETAAGGDNNHNITEPFVQRTRSAGPPDDADDDRGDVVSLGGQRHAHGAADQCASSPGASIGGGGEKTPYRTTSGAASSKKKQQQQPGWMRLKEKYGGLVKPDIVFFGEGLPRRFFDLANQDLPRARILLVVGTSLSVQPFASLINHVDDRCLRVLVNRDPVGVRDKRIPTFVAQQLGLGGFEFDDPRRNYRDVALLGDCDAEIFNLAEALGWKDDLQRLVDDARRRWQQKRTRGGGSNNNNNNNGAEWDPNAVDRATLEENDDDPSSLTTPRTSLARMPSKDTVVDDENHRKRPSFPDLLHHHYDDDDVDALSVDALSVDEMQSSPKLLPGIPPVLHHPTPPL